MDYEFKIKQISSKFKWKLPKSDLESIHSLAENREWGLALENLCTQLYEYDLTISQEQYMELEEMINKMELDNIYLNQLRKLKK